MSKLQEHLEILQDTVVDLRDAINEQGVECSPCTPFRQYPDLVRSINGSGVRSSSVVTVFAYKISNDGHPGIPKGGSFNFDTNEYEVATSWVKSDNLSASDRDTVGMTQAMFASNSNNAGNLVDGWSAPIKLASLTQATTDYKHEIYQRTATNQRPDQPVSNGFTTPYGWSSAKLGLDAAEPYIWVSEKTDETGSWSIPVLYAYLAKDGAQGPQGPQGPQGIPGQDGEDGKTSRITFAFKLGNSNINGPETPYGGSWNLSTNDITLPDGWDHNPPNKTDDMRFVWLSMAEFVSTKPNNPTGSKPTCITGEDGVEGTDGLNSEFVYAILKSTDHFEVFKTYLESEKYSLEISDTDTVPHFIHNGEDTGSNILNVQTEGYDFNVTITDFPEGIDDVNKVEIYWTRTKSSEGTGNPWIGPMYWSVGGENGMDGDGVEYIFSVSSDSTGDYPIPTYAELLEREDQTEALRFQEREYCPEGWFDNDENGEFTGVGPDAPGLFCAMRKQYFNEEENKQMGGDFSEPKIGGHGGRDGMGAYTSFMFYISKEDLSNYVVTGGTYEKPIEGLKTQKPGENGTLEDVQIQWTDSLSKTPAFDETIWMINKFFNNSPTEAEDKWFGPMKMADSEHFQVEFNCPMMEDEKSEYDPFKTPDKPYYLPSLQTFKEESAQSGITFNTNDELEAAGRDYVKNEGYGTWTDGGKNAVYMATARFVNNKWEDGSVNKIRGEKGDAGNSTQFIFKLGSYSPLDNPTPDLTNEDLAKAYQNADYKPEDGEYAPQSIKKDTPVCWMSKRDCKNGIWEAYSDPSIGAMYAEGNRTFELSEDEINIPCEPSGYIDESYADFITVTFSLYDSGTLVDVKDCYYSALINDDKDHLITSNDSNLNKEDPTTCGFDGRILYIGKEFLNNHYQLEGNLRVECQVKYSAIGEPEQDGVSYTKILWIKKSTNAYELNITPNVIHISSDGKCKNDQINIHPTKYVDGIGKQVDTGRIDYILTTSNEDNSTISDSVDITDLGAQIPLTEVSNLLNVSIKYIQIIDDKEVEVSSEEIGVTRDANDAVSKYLAQIFCRTNAQIGNDEYVPKGGTYLNPNDLDEDSPQIPVMGADGQSSSTTQGTDGVPTYDKENPMLLWMSYRGFYSDDNMNEGEKWSIPILMQDTSTIDIWWCDDNVSDPGNPDSHPNNVVGYDGDINNPGSEGGSNNQTHNPYWMAIRYTIDGVQTGGRVSKIQAEDGKDGKDGKDAVAQFKSYAFAWLTNEEAANNEPTGGSYADPVPNAPGEDGVPTKPSDDTKRLYCSYAWFTSDGSGDSKGSEPQVMADSADFDVEFSSELTPGSPSGHPNTNDDWTQDSTNAIGMATSKLSEGIGSPWKVVKIKGEDGKDGQSFNMKGTQPTTDDLPKNGNTIGDAYIVNKHVWVGDGYQGKDCGDLQGPQGDPGEPGKSQYIHIKYATKDSNDDYTFTNRDGEDPGDYIGICVNDNPDDPDNEDAYKGSYAKGADGGGYEFIYKRTSTNNGGNAPTSEQSDGHRPSGGTNNPVGVDPTNKGEGVSHRVKRDNTGGSGSTPALGSYYGDVHDYYVYIYQEGDGKPSKPTFSNKTYNSDLNLGNWADYPTLDGTSQGGQCILTVEGGTNKIVNVSEVVPVNGQPGADGSYTEFRFRGTNSSDDVPSRPTSAQPTDGSVTTPSKGEGDNILWMIHAEKTSTGEFKNNGGSDPVQISGEQGAGVSEIKEFYLLTNSDKKPAYTENGQDTPKQPTKDLQYLWNYEATYINGSTEPIHKSTPYLLSKWKDGRGIVEITDYYAISDSDTTKPAGYATSDTANGYIPNNTWKTESPVLTPTDKYLWNFEIIEYNREPCFEVTEPCVIGVYGDTGPQGPQGDKGAKMRYGIGKTGVAYQNGSEGDEFYDIVSYNNNRYLCTKDHTSSSNILPTNIEYGKSANEFEFLATTVFVSSIADIKDLVVEKLRTKGDNTILINSGIMTATSNNKSKMEIGIDASGDTVINFYNSSGNLTWQLGPSGLISPNEYKLIDTYTIRQVYPLSYNNLGHEEVINKLKNNIASVNNVQEVYTRTHYEVIGGTRKDLSGHGFTFIGSALATRLNGHVLGGSELLGNSRKEEGDYEYTKQLVTEFNSKYGGNVPCDPSSEYPSITIYRRMLYTYEDGTLKISTPLYYAEQSLAG